MNWKPHTEQPEATQSVLIAHRCLNDGEYFLSSEIHVWSASCACFKSELTGQKLHLSEFWWIPESEVLEGLPK